MFSFALGWAPPLRWAWSGRPLVRLWIARMLCQWATVLYNPCKVGPWKLPDQAYSHVSMFEYKRTIHLIMFSCNSPLNLLFTFPPHYTYHNKVRTQVICITLPSLKHLHVAQHFAWPDLLYSIA